MKEAFVTDARSIASLATVRSLGSKGISVTSGESFRANYTFFSKYVRRTVVYRDPSQFPEEFAADLLREITSREYGTILSFRDETNLLLSQYRNTIQRYTRICLAEHDALLIARDKGRTVQAAMEAGVPTPTTFFPEEESIQEIARQATFPLLVRPRISSGARGIEFARDSAELQRTYEKVKSAYGEPIIQQYIEHTREHLSACFLFNHASELRASFVYQELRQYPVNGGPATYAVSVRNPVAVQLGAEFLKRLGWKGVAHIDFLVDPKDNVAKLLEVNPRFWMSLPLAIFCGVDFPYLLYQLAVHGDVPSVPEYQIGRYYRWLLPADILWFLSVRKDWRSVREFMRFRNPKPCYAVLSKRDPLPVLGFILQTLYFLSDRTRRDFMFHRGW